MKTNVDKRISKIHTCIDRIVLDELILETTRRAIVENPDNAPSFKTRNFLPGVMPNMPHRLAGLTGKLWNPGRTLRVKFLEGDTRVHERIIPFVHQWSEYANIYFEFTDDPQAEIRISFSNTGSWSYLGTDALTIEFNKPTMNFGWLTRSISDIEYSSVVLHEFGHALGMIHEHQNPAGNIPWNKNVVYRLLAGPPNNWSRQQVDHNLFNRYSSDVTQFSELDPHSIMIYPIPNQFTHGNFEIGWNYALSDMDKHFINVLYPKEESKTIELQIDAPAVEAKIGEHGEVDTYTFTLVESDVSIRVETEGEENVVISLFGPNDSTIGITEGDANGTCCNARVIAKLSSGEYTVRVRHYDEQQTGNYKIGVYRCK